MKKFFHIFEKYLTVFSFFVIYLFLSVYVFIRTNFDAYTSDEILFFLNMPIKGIEFKTLFQTICFVFILPVFCCYTTLLLCRRLFIKTNLKKNFWHFLCIFGITATVFLCTLLITKIKPVSISLAQKSTAVETKIFIPKQKNIHFPLKKNNLIIILLESFEQTFKNADFYHHYLLKPLDEFEKQGITFTRFQDGFGQTPSTPSLIALYTGLPAYTKPALKKQLPHANIYSLGKILKNAGYTNVALIACQGSYANSREFFIHHGMHQVIDLETIEQTYPEIQNKNSWGYADSDMFWIARQQIEKLENNQPFFLLIQTMDTHADYRPPRKVNNMFDREPYNIIYNTAQETADFLKWLQKRQIFHSTTIVVLGDHLRKGTDIRYPKNRTVYNLFINAVPTTKNTNRTFNQIDLFPSVLEASGAKIKNHKLGLGTSLFSELPTLAEQYSPIELKNYMKQHRRLSEMLQDKTNFIGDGYD